ncbi:hypothetical protein D3C87_913000 [compost metagenome]
MYWVYASSLNQAGQARTMTSAFAGSAPLLRVETVNPRLTRWLLRPSIGMGVEKRSSQMIVSGPWRLESVTALVWASTSRRP